MVKKTSWASLVGGRFIDFAFGPILVIYDRRGFIRLVTMGILYCSTFYP